ncbi:NLR family, CARD domain containing 3 [Seminavis robusta]|uniref:NLR family, CARD domain containing 3 n=1 Tax=Seminavis robusta TaxID=568900 RepID=A0A9N8ESU2_9STRA|nr:NLR family, CARD domain containing 3 [Seminavis robusta]|eukprot:Sro1723_g293650.1 NLR family, CARD domain containing 3 (1197) ;mRNA; r:15041-18631
MVKLRNPNGCASSCISRSYPIYLVTKEVREKLGRDPPPDADSYYDPETDSDYFDYNKGTVCIRDYDAVAKMDMEVQDQIFLVEFYEKARNGHAYRYEHLKVTLKTANEREPKQVKAPPPPPLPVDNVDVSDDFICPSFSGSSSSDSSESEEEEKQETDEEIAKRRLVASGCDSKPGVNHGKLNIYSASRGKRQTRLSQSSQGCGNTDILERTGRPEDLIDLLFEKQPNQLQFGHVAPSLSTYLAQKAASVNSLQVIELNNVYGDATIQLFNKLLQAFSEPGGSGPQVLRVCSGRDMPYDFLSALEAGFRSNSSIRTLDVGCMWLTQHCCEPFCRFVALAVSSLQNLTTLDLSETKACEEDDPDVSKSRPRPESLDPLLNLMPTLMKLTAVQLRSSRLPEELFSRLITGVCALPMLEYLNLACTNCGPNALVSISDLLRKDGCTLKTLNLTGMFSAGQGGHEAPPSKQVIDFSSIFGTLAVNTSLTTLKLGGNDLVAGGMKQLAEAMCANTSLTNLHLDTIYCTDGGFEVFFSLLPNMRGLVLLDISDNTFEEEGLNILVDKIASTNLTLRHVEAVDVQSSETALGRLVEVVAKVEEMTSNVSQLDPSKIDDWTVKTSLYLKVKDDTTVVPPRRYGDGEKPVGTAEFLREFVHGKIALLKDGTVKPSDCILFLKALDSSKPGVEIEIRHDEDEEEYNPGPDKRQDFYLFASSGKLADAAKVIMNLGIPRVSVTNQISDEFFVGLTTQLDCKEPSNCLKTLKIKQVKISTAGAVLMKKMLTVSSSLDHIELSDLVSDDTHDPTFVLDEEIPMGTLPALKTLVVSSVKLSKGNVEILAWVLSAAPSLEKLEMRYAYAEDVDNMKTLCRGFEKNESLRFLKVSFEKETEGALLALTKGFAFLDSVDMDIQFNKVTPAILEALGSSLLRNKSKRVKLVFHHTCGDVDVSPLARSLKENQSLKTLSLYSGLDWNSAGKMFEDAGVDALKAALIENPTIESLHIMPSNLTASAATCFYSAIGSMKGLRQLGFVKCKRCGDRGDCKANTDVLVEGLLASETLEKLAMHYSDDDAVELFPALLQIFKAGAPATLTAIDLVLHDDAFDLDALFVALAANTTLKELKIQMYAEESHWEKLGKALTQNDTVEKLTIVNGFSIDRFVALLPEMKCLKELRLAGGHKPGEKIAEKAKDTHVNVVFVSEED